MFSTAICLLILGHPSKGPVLGMDGLSHDPLKENRGKPTALIFITHDCPICNAYAPQFMRLKNRFEGKIRIQLVYSEPEITVAQANAHAKEFAMTKMGSWLDRSRTFAASCGATVVPEAIIFSAEGEKVWTGRIDNQYASLGVHRQQATVHDLQDALDDLSKGKSPSPPHGQPVGCLILSPVTP